MQRHETKEDRDNEEAIISEFCWAFGLTYQKLHHEGRYKLDYGIYNGDRKLISLAEVKDRGASFDTIIMDLSKFREMHHYTTMGLSCVFIVRVPEGIHYCRFYEHQLLGYARSAKLHVSAKRETDNGPVVHIPWKHFASLPSGNK